MKNLSVALLAVILGVVACTNKANNDLVSEKVYAEAETPDPPLLEVYSEMLPPMPEPHWHIHDPTQLVKLGDYWMIGVTGKAPTRLYPCGLEI